MAMAPGGRESNSIPAPRTWARGGGAPPPVLEGGAVAEPAPPSEHPAAPTPITVARSTARMALRRPDGLVVALWWAAAANRRLAASSVGPIGSTIGPPCVLAMLGSRRPGVAVRG
jgi:hypothetical protein